MYFISSSYFRSQMRCAQVYAVFLSALVASQVWRRVFIYLLSYTCMKYCIWLFLFWVNVVRLFYATVVFLIYGIKCSCIIILFIYCYEVKNIANVFYDIVVIFIRLRQRVGFWSTYQDGWSFLEKANYLTVFSFWCRFGGNRHRKASAEV